VDPVVRLQNLDVELEELRCGRTDAQIACGYGVAGPREVDGELQKLGVAGLVY
jgi:hypothetical protein